MQPQLARWTTPDPELKGPVGLSFSLNPYRYTEQNPPLYWDPTGTFDETVHGALTFQLAVTAGFTEHDAARLALMTASVDHDPKTMPTRVWNIVSGVTKDMHFISTKDALSRVTKEMAKGASMDMVKLGKALHTLEDVGFEGAPGPHHDSPYIGHRFGNEDGTTRNPGSHRADQAYRNKDANRKELHEIFDVLLKPLRRNMAKT